MTRILYLAPVQWNCVRQRPQQLALRLARHFDVHYVEPVGLRSLRLSDFRRVWQAAKTPWQRPAPLPLVRPRYVPVVGHRLLDPVNRRWLWRQLSAQFQSGDDDWVLWIGTPSLLAETLIEHASPRLIVYDCMDRYAAFHGGATATRIDRTEAAILRRADLVFASSHGLAERLDRLHEVTLVPNGVETDVFTVGRRNRPAWRHDLAGPVIGFYGTLGAWLDYDLLAAMGRDRPGWSFVFAGPQASREFDRLKPLSNVRYLGVVGYDDLPRHAAWFDVGIVPFRLNALTRYVHPIKALEYLALGLPVVSSPLADLCDLSHVINFGRTAGEWLAAIEESFSTESRCEQKANIRRRSVLPYDWDSRAELIVEKLNERLGTAITTPTYPESRLGRRLQIANCPETCHRQLVQIAN